MSTPPDAATSPPSDFASPKSVTLRCRRKQHQVRRLDVAVDDVDAAGRRKPRAACTITSTNFANGIGPWTAISARTSRPVRTPSRKTASRPLADEVDVRGSGVDARRARLADKRSTNAGSSASRARSTFTATGGRAPCPGAVTVPMAPSLDVLNLVVREARRGRGSAGRGRHRGRVTLRERFLRARIDSSAAGAVATVLSDPLRVARPRDVDILPPNRSHVHAPPPSGPSSPSKTSRRSPRKSAASSSASRRTSRTSGSSTTSRSSRSSRRVSALTGCRRPHTVPRGVQGPRLHAYPLSVSRSRPL